MKEMKYTVVEEFLKNNPDFNIYNSNPIKRRFEKAITVNGDYDFEGLNNPYIINSNDEVITLISLKENGNEIYHLVD
jgi:hypothetical protein